MAQDDPTYDIKHPRATLFTFSLNTDQWPTAINLTTLMSVRLRDDTVLINMDALTVTTTGEDANSIDISVVAGAGIMTVPKGNYYYTIVVRDTTDFDLDDEIIRGRFIII